MKLRMSLLLSVVLSTIIAASINGIATDNASSNGTPPPAAVKIDNFSFSPATIAVPVGTTVKWTNSDDIPHTVVSNDSVFKSKVLDTDEQFTYTFTKPGTYPYFCSIHPKMVGTVVVR